MVCPTCKTTNPDHATDCSDCGGNLSDPGDATIVSFAPLEDQSVTAGYATLGIPPVNDAGRTVIARSGDETVIAGHTAALSSTRASDENTQAIPENTPGWSNFESPSNSSDGALCLLPGSLLGGRYKILRSLGEGGMGAVYQAHDLEVDRLVAIKVIRPELANNPGILRRFKQELILARQVTHRNIVRIYDLGVADNIKFISMEFIEGHELTALVEESGKLEPRRAAEIMLQVALGLQAAHAEGVVHRDLKPQNIMIDAQGRVAVMDFGIAHSTAGTTPRATASPAAAGNLEGGLTLAGSLLGTPRYMSPEQAKGQPTDARSDIFTVGIILYELLTAENPFAAQTGRETLKKRIEQNARPPIEVNPQIPKPLNLIVLKCLVREPAGRYASAGELVHDLEIWLGIRNTLRASQMRRMRWLAGGLGALLVAAAGVLGWNFTRPQTNQPYAPVKLLVSDFANRTGEPVLNGTLEPMLQVALERAPFVTAYSRGEAHKAAAELKPGVQQMDAPLARLVALREGLGIVVSGAIEKHGSGLRLSADATNVAKGESLVSRHVDIPGTREIPEAVEQLAGRIRRALGDVTGVPKTMAEETFTSASLDAAQRYSQAQDLQWNGKWEEAIADYRKAIALDPNLSRAYAGLAATLANQGQRQEAEKCYQLALAHIARMSDREKYRTRGGYYLLTRDYQKATEQFRALVSQYPADTAAIANLALAYFYARNMSAALEQGQKAVDIYPNNLLQRNNLALYAKYAGDFDRAIKEENAVLQKNPSFALAYQGLAMAYLAKGDEDKAEDAYAKLSKLGKWGASEAALGLADLAVYRSTLPQAVELLSKGIQQDLADGNQSAAATKRVVLAGVELQLGRRAQAVESAVQAMQGSSDFSVLYPAAHVLIEAGKTAEALAVAAKLGGRFEPEPRAFAKLIEGEAALSAHKAQPAVAAFEEAQKLADTWLGRFDLGRAYLDGKLYPDADNEFDVCLKRRGEASSVFLDDEPTLRYLPPVYYYEGLARVGLNSPAATESFKTFLAIKHSATGDPLVADARRRLK